MNKKLVVDLRMWNHSGIGRYLRNLIPKIYEKSEGISYIFLYESGHEKDLKQQFENAELIPCQSKIYSLSEQFELRKVLSKIEYDLLWIPHYNVPLFHHKKLLVTVHDLIHIHIYSVKKSWHKKLYANLLFKQISIKSKKIITVSEYTKNDLEINFPSCKNKIVSIHNGLSAPIQSHEIEPKDVESYILYVGNIKPHKNLISLVEAFKKYLLQTQYNLVIVGQSENLISADEKLLSILKDNALRQRIKFKGQVNDEKLAQLYKEAALFVSPSLFEGFGFPPLEAMSYDCPVVCSDRCSLPEVCKDAAYYVEALSIDSIGKGVLEVLNNKELRDDLVQKGKSLINKYQWEKTADKTLDVIKECLN